MGSFPLLVVLCLALCSLCVSSLPSAFKLLPPSPRRGFKGKCCWQVPSGTLLFENEKGESAVEFPSGEVHVLETCSYIDHSLLNRTMIKEKEEERKRKRLEESQVGGVTERMVQMSSNPDNQWVAWYFASCAVSGCKNIASKWTTPDNPTDKNSDLAIFNGLQPTYDPEPYDFVMQPVSMWGTVWFENVGHQWGGVATTCNNGHCIASEPFVSGTRHEIYGNVTKITSDTFQINILDLTNGNSTNVLYKTSYLITFAFLTLEHAPGGDFGSCAQVEVPPYEITFTDVVVHPPLIGGYWEGTQNNFGCGLSVDTFAFGPDYTINL